MNIKNIVTVSALVLVAGLAQGSETAYGFNARNELVRFETNNPGSVLSIGAITGIVPSHTLRSIDFRPNGNGLYGLSTDGTTGAQVYTIDLNTGAATPVGAGFSLAGTLSSTVSIDFNPSVDRLRIVSLSGQSYRWNPVSNAFVQRDSDTIWDASSGFSGTALHSAIAYSNNRPGATPTTLYAYEYSNDRLTTIGGINSTPSPNGGVTFGVGSTGLFALGLDTSFDISSVTDLGYAGVRNLGAPVELFNVNLATGAHTSAGVFGDAVIDFAIVPAPSALAVLGMGGLMIGRRRR
jgi:hypothetical protein